MSEDFENFLSERNKRRKVRDPETISYYRNLFKKYLEGGELSEELVEYVAWHRNGWLRNVFRHHVQYLISLEDVRKTMIYSKENHGAYYIV
ncbi:MAG: hypothetical protein QXQ31_08640 [Zestosphaera sp.]